LIGQARTESLRGISAIDRAHASRGHARSDPRGAKTVSDANQFMIQRYTHGIGIMKPQRNAATMPRQRIPRPLPLKTISRRVPSMLRQNQRIWAAATQAQPMMVMMEIANSRLQPT